MSKVPDLSGIKNTIERRKEVYDLCYRAFDDNFTDEEIKEIRRILLDLYPKHNSFGSPAKSEWREAFNYLNSSTVGRATEKLFQPFLINTTQSFIGIIFSALVGYFIAQWASDESKYQQLGQQLTELVSLQVHMQNQVESKKKAIHDQKNSEGNEILPKNTHNKSSSPDGHKAAAGS